MTAAPGRPSAAALRKLARQRTEAAVEVLAEVATTGSSEASRVSAATALLERGYGKSGMVPAGEGSRSPLVYYRIELIDGSKDHTELNPDQPAEDAGAGDQG